MTNPPQAAPPLLRMQGIHKAFGATQALVDVRLEVAAGEVMALIGENGAGKSTLMKILAGAHSADGGTMTIGGKPYAPTSPQDARDAGVAMIYQELMLAPDLSVEDNIMLGQECSRWGVLNRRQQRERVHSVLDLLGHAELRPDTPVRTLSAGAKQLIEIARALAMEARLIVFDEPTSSLSQRDAEHLFQVIRKLKRSRVAVIYISHFLEEIRKVCTKFTVLRDGSWVGDGNLKGATEPQIISMMVGRDVKDLFPTVPHTPGETILEVDRIHGPSGNPTDVSFNLRQGEILGIAGLVGAGRTETLRLLFGLDPTTGGTIKIRGKHSVANPRARIAAGLGLVSEDRKEEGLAQERSIEDNVTLSRLAPYSTLGWLNLGRRRSVVNDTMKKLHVKARDAGQAVSKLSGGNQQKVAIARVVHQDADVLLLDEPTRGIDVGTKSEVYRLMGELAAQGKAIIFVSSYLPELMAVADRIGVMARGRLREIRPTKEWTEEEVMSVAIRLDDV